MTYWKLVARTIVPISSLFVAKRHPPTLRNMGKFETRSGVGISGVLHCWSTKAAISLKRVKIQEKLLWRAYRKSPTLCRTVPSPTPMASCSQDWGSKPTPKTSIAIISGTAKATYSKFGRYTDQMVHPNKSLLKISEKRERGRIRDRGLPKFFEYPIFLSQERVKLRTSNFVRTFI